MRAKKDPQGRNISVVEPDRFPHMVTTIESHLSSHVSVHPTLNFILYTPAREHTPLHLLDADGNLVENNAFLSPRWGGFVVHNLDPISDLDPRPVKHLLDMKPAMETFLTQLRLLMGIPNQVGIFYVKR